MSEVRIGATMRLHNATIRDARHALGLTQQQLAAKARVNVALVSGLETLRIVKITEAAQRVLDILGLTKDASPQWLDELRPQRVQQIERSVTAELVAQPERLAIEQEIRTHTYEPDPFEAVAASMNRDILMRALAQMPERESQIIVRRYGLGNQHPQTLDEIGHALNLSREQVRQLEGRALARFPCFREWHQ